MTIKIEQEALLQVIQHPRNGVLRPQQDYIVDICQPLEKAISFDETDEGSIFTTSTTEPEEITRTVSFSEDLVTEEWQRPFTPIEDIPELFYSADQISR